MANMQVGKNWSPVRILEQTELARGGLDGNMNEQAKALAERTELLKDEKADLIYVNTVVSAAAEGIIPFQMETDLLLSKPDKLKVLAKALDTKKEWLWNRTSADGVTPVAGNWTDAGLSDVDLMQTMLDTPELVFTSSISVDSNGVVSFPIFYGVKTGAALKKYESLYTFTPEQYGYFYAIYYNFGTHSISTTTAMTKKANKDECLIGIAYSGRFSSKYAVKYKGETNVIPKLSNEILNGVLNPALPIDTLYGYTNQSSIDYAPIVSVNNDILKSLGIRNAQKLEASGKRGGFGQAQLFDRKLRSLKCAIGVVVYDETGIFNFGTSGGVLLYFQKLNADGTSLASFSSSTIITYTELSPNIRLYKYASKEVSLNQTIHPDSYISNVLVGCRVGTDAPSPIYVSGYWFSYADDVKGYKYPISLTDTHYPNYQNVSSASIYSYFSAKATTNTENIASI